MKNTEKQERFFRWLDMPREERKPPYRSWLAKELGVCTATLVRWEDDRRQIELEQTRELLDRLTSNLDELKKIALTTDNKELADMARRKLWLIGMHEGKWQSLTDFLKSTGEFTEKKEATIKYELTNEDREYIANRAVQIQRDFSRRRSRKIGVSAKPPLLPK
jgi:hypothetical protein